MKRLLLIMFGLMLSATAAYATDIVAPICLPSTASVDVSALDCSNNPGPYITLEGEITFDDGVFLNVIFKNNVKGTHTMVVEDAFAVEIIAAGESITIPKQPSLGGTGGNPLIFLQFVDEDGDPLSREFFIGKCVQLNK